MPEIAIPLPRLGIDLKSEETRLPAGAVRHASNVDIDRDGQIRRRKGYALRRAGEWLSLHSWEGFLIAQRGAEIVRIDPDSMDELPLCRLQSAEAVSFAEYNGSLYWTNPSSGLWVLSDWTAKRAGVALPAVLPSLDGGSDGPAHMVAVSLVDQATGEESAAAMIGQTHGAVRLTNMSMLQGFNWRVYVTPPDGDVLYLAEEFPAVWPQYAVSFYPEGAQCQTLHRELMPGGQLVRGWQGRTYVARGNTLWYSDALRPHLCAPRHNFVRFTGSIRFMEFVDGGAYVGDAKGVWWLAGTDPEAWALRLASNAQAVAQSSLLLPAYELGALQSRSSSMAALWLSTDGHMVGSADGQVTALNSDRLSLLPGQVGRSRLVQRDGLSQVITLTATTDLAADLSHAIDTKGNVKC